MPVHYQLVNPYTHASIQLSAGVSIYICVPMLVYLYIVSWYIYIHIPMPTLARLKCAIFVFCTIYNFIWVDLLRYVVNVFPTQHCNMFTA